MGKIPSLVERKKYKFRQLIDFRCFRYMAPALHVLLQFIFCIFPTSFVSYSNNRTGCQSLKVNDCPVSGLRPTSTDPEDRNWYNYYSIPKMHYHCDSRTGVLALWNNPKQTLKQVVKPVHMFVTIGTVGEVDRVFRYQGWYQVTRALALKPEELQKVVYNDPEGVVGEAVA
jgi:hypothetical protein